MPRKKIVTDSELTPALLKFREKRKWQITFRRYVVEQQSCPAYAPYFGLDIQMLRNWFESQFTDQITWEGFGKHWQFEHVVPVAYFDFSKPDELAMCWNFTNIKVVQTGRLKEGGAHFDSGLAKNYFKELYAASEYPICLQLIEKIEQLEAAGQIPTQALQSFLYRNKEYLDKMEGFAQYEFELLNMGKSMQEVEQERNMIRKMGM